MTNTNNNNYKVCILAAGKGLRLGKLTKSLNKCLLPVNGKAVLTHIIEKFNTSIEIIIAVGYEAKKVKEYISHAHPDRKIKFVDVKNYDQAGSGPGQSLLECKEYLQCPFVLTVGDSIVTDVIPPPDFNWLGLAQIDPSETGRYCSAKIDNGKIIYLNDKEECKNKYAFIGIAGIESYSTFWNGLECNKNLIKNERQVSNGLNSLIVPGLNPEVFDWVDTGTVENYKNAKIKFEGENSFDFSKIDEFIYFVNDLVIKYFADTNQIKNRHKRSLLIKNSCPSLIKSTEYFFSYKHIKGRTVYEVLNPNLVEIFFKWCKNNLWEDVDISNEQFKNLCKSFYYDKTMGRLDKFYQKYPDFNNKNTKINNGSYETIEELLSKIDWSSINSGSPVTFHGDLQFDNILRTGWSEKDASSFKVIDWRGDFAKSTDVGDLYYDLSKLYGGMILPYNLIKKNCFDFEYDNGSANYNFKTSHMLNESKQRYEKIIKFENLDLCKIKILTGLIFLNMSPLHHYPFDHMLYHMARYQLSESLNNVS